MKWFVVQLAGVVKELVTAVAFPVAVRADALTMTGDGVTTVDDIPRCF
jgi:hypothetical protein